MLDRVTAQDAYPPPAAGAGAQFDPPPPCHHPQCPHLASKVTPTEVTPTEVNPREVLAQRLLGGALMLVLIGFAGLLWGIDGAFRILFTVYTVWAGFWLYALFVKRPTV